MDEYEVYEIDDTLVDDLVKTLVDGGCCPSQYEHTGYCSMDEYGVDCDDCWKNYIIGGAL